MITSVEKRIPLQTGLYLFNFHWQNRSIFGGNIHPEYYVADFGTSYTLLSRPRLAPRDGRRRTEILTF